ncbi:MAG: prepilin-type N-terminal cleavage/methylation domain-containing protein [Betaproteobacteria bacterium]|nr:prepilin-type N-terminal cleavage/methylation domain-containing protein [Betaproteobacteria bacterium]
MMAAMQRLPHSFSKQAIPPGFTLVELCVVLALLAITTSWAAPALQHWLWRLRVETVTQAWLADLQAARVQAFRGGQALQLQRIPSCGRKPTHDGDWRLINAQGEAVAGGLRVVIQGQGPAPVVRSICINTTGRARVVQAATCA